MQKIQCKCGGCWIRTSVRKYELYVAPPEPKRMKGGVIVRCEQQDRIVIIQSCSLKWGFPKGKREAGESLLDTGRRELSEETGLALGRDMFFADMFIDGRHTRYYATMLDDVDTGVMLKNLMRLDGDTTGIAFIKPSCVPVLTGFNGEFRDIMWSQWHVRLPKDQRIIPVHLLTCNYEDEDFSIHNHKPGKGSRRLSK